MKNYYPLKIIKDEKLYFCIWYTNDVDGILLENKKIKAFCNFDDLKSYCVEKKIDINPDITTYNLDKVLTCLSSCERDVDCILILNFWNLMFDLSRSTNDLFYGNSNETLGVYEKLFFGNNLPAIHRGGEKYIPQWDNEEYTIIRNVIENGMELFDKYI